MITKPYVVPDGNDAIRGDLSAVIELIERTAQWVHPETFRRLPVWCPQTARGQALFDSQWSRQYTNTKKATGQTSDKYEGNVAALKALIAALGVRNPKPKNWTVCHIWGYDDPGFVTGSVIVQDPRYFSCVANMVWLPTPLKGFTDALPEVKRMLRACAFHLYGWACEHPSVAAQVASIRAGELPSGYPSSWPSLARPGILPPGTAPFTEAIQAEIVKRKRDWKLRVTDPSLIHYPRDQVLSVLKFWNVTL